MKVLFRCDSSYNIGSGHVMRCRNLARSLKRRGAQIWFICRLHDGCLTSSLKEEFNVIELVRSESEIDSLNLKNDHHNPWLGCSQQQDAEECSETIKRRIGEAPDWCCVDHYGIDSTWQERLVSLLNRRPNFLVIDDLANRSHYADILVDPNFYGLETTRRYDSLLLNQKTIKLLGPEHALIGEEYNKAIMDAKVRSKVTNVMIFFGGSDTLGLTARAIGALNTSEFRDIELDVVVGIQNKDIAYIRTQCSGRKGTRLHIGLPSLVGVMSKADMCIGAGGSTTWERACLGLPSLVVCVAENQREGIRELNEYLGLPTLSLDKLEEDIRVGLREFNSGSLSTELTSAALMRLTKAEGCKIIGDFMEMNERDLKRTPSVLERTSMSR